MDISNIDSFLSYYEKVRGRTHRLIERIPPDEIEWSYAKGKFTLGDLLRHLGAIERYMFAETIRADVSRYPGHGRELADGYEAILMFLERTHRESVAIFRSLSDKDLVGKCMTPAGAPISRWKWLRAMVEHEIHHRGQMYVYLAMLGVSTPPLYGLSSEDVKAKSQPPARI